MNPYQLTKQAQELINIIQFEPETEEEKHIRRTREKELKWSGPMLGDSQYCILRSHMVRASVGPRHVVENCHFEIYDYCGDSRKLYELQLIENKWKAQSWRGEADNFEELQQLANRMWLDGDLIVEKKNE